MKIRIESDFDDFYDYLSDSNETELIYKRFTKDRMNRIKSLKYLQKYRIETLEIKQPYEFLGEATEVEIYTDQNSHGTKGKRIVKLDDAIRNYYNYPASIVTKPDDGMLYKYLQIGSRRFQMTIDLENKTPKSLVENKSEFSDNFMFPIYSIDYEIINSEYIAVDFMNIVKLNDIGVNYFMKPEEVIGEIYKFYKEGRG